MNKWHPETILTLKELARGKVNHVVTLVIRRPTESPSTGELEQFGRRDIPRKTKQNSIETHAAASLIIIAYVLQRCKNADLIL